MQAKVVSFGEAMVRLTPLDHGSSMYGRGKPSARANFMQSVGGDELNVTVRQTRPSAFACRMWANCDVWST